MGLSYDICQDDGCIASPVARGDCQAALATIGEVKPADDVTAGGLAKALKSTNPLDVPVFLLHGQVAVDLTREMNDPTFGIDLSWKANHYRVIFRLQNMVWHAFRITPLPPMMYFNKASREAMTQVARTQLMANSFGQQFAAAPGDDYANNPGAGGDNYANAPGGATYANIPGCHARRDRPGRSCRRVGFVDPRHPRRPIEPVCAARRRQAGERIRRCLGLGTG
jgi:hypothetical protein